MASKLKKWGNSMGLRIPKDILDRTDLTENSEVEFEVKDGNIIIQPKSKEYSLKTMLKEITEDNLHQEIDSGLEGKEVW